MEKQIILLCGLPLSGKTTLGKKLSARLKIPFLDIDEIRHALFQNPPEEMESEQDRFQMEVSYKALFYIIEVLTKLGHSFIIAAIFSREERQKRAIEILGIETKVVHCFAPEQVIKRRIIEREERRNSFSGCRTWEHYKADQERYQIFPSPRLDLDTSQSAKECLRKIIRFVGA